MQPGTSAHANWFYRRYRLSSGEVSARVQGDTPPEKAKRCGYHPGLGRVVDILEASGAFDPGSSPGRGATFFQSESRANYYCKIKLSKREYFGYFKITKPVSLRAQP